MNLDRMGRWAWWGAAVATLVVIGVSGSVLFRPFPPRRFVLATGPPGGAYSEAGERYREILARDGIRLELRQTEGAVENLALLNDPASGVSAGFVQSGTTSASASPELASLGAVFEEPLWLFCRCESADLSLRGLSGRKVSIGSEGSGTRAFALKLLALNGIDPKDLTLLDLSPDEAARQLLDGSIDAAAILTSWESPAVRRLLASPDVNLLGFPRADAYVALLPYLDKIAIPMGVGDLALNRPASDVTIVGSKASLAVRRSLHPALQYVLLEAAHAPTGATATFLAREAFPVGVGIDLPLSEDARSFYASGPTLLQRYLPFWLADLVERLIVGLLPIVGVLYPLWSIAPRIFEWYMNRRIHHPYLDLRRIERELHSRPAGAATADLEERLARLERHVSQLQTPVAFAAAKYQLQAHIRQVAQSLRGGSRP